jgi:glutathione S-transferase
MLKILGRPNSINVRKVLWLCEELALPCQHEPWGYGELSLQSPEFLALNPNALVPVIRDGDFVLWESNAICRYLAGPRAGLAARHDLLPVQPQARAIVEQWMDWQAGELNNAWRYAFMALVRKSPAHTDESAVQHSLQQWAKHMRIVEATLARSGAFMTGANFTLADIVIGLAVHRWFMTPMQHPDLPAVGAYYERLSQRPAYLQHGRNGLP